MKKLNVFVLLCLLVQSMAWASPAQGLKTVVDEYQFALTVEWDQKDQAALKDIQNKFQASLKQLIQEQGLNAADLGEFLRQHGKELKIDKNVLKAMHNEAGQLDLAKAHKVLSDKSADLYMQGSSWAPDIETLLYIGIGTLVVFEIVVLIITSRSDTCPNPEYHPNDVPYPCIYE